MSDAKDEEIAELKRQLAAKDKEIAELKSQLAAKDEEGTPPAWAAAKADGNSDKLLRQRSIYAVAESEAGRELLQRAMKSARQGKQVDGAVLTQLWQEHDADGDGSLTVDELRPLVRASLVSTILARQ